MVFSSLMLQITHTHLKVWCFYSKFYYIPFFFFFFFFFLFLFLLSPFPIIHSSTIIFNSFQLQMTKKNKKNKKNKNSQRKYKGQP